jgi:hypothetical protein
MKINLNSNDFDDETWYGTIVNDINNRIVTFLTENFENLEEDEKRDIAQELTERLTVERNNTL